MTPMIDDRLITSYCILCFVEREKPKAVIGSCIRLVQSLKLKKSQRPIRSSFDAAAEVEGGALDSRNFHNDFHEKIDCCGSSAFFVVENPL